MFCSSLRKRKEWAPLVSLLSHDKDSRCAERPLTTHDIALPLVSEKPQGQAQADGRFFRFILLSAADVGTPKTQERIERLYSFDGGRLVGILFYLGGEPAAAYAAFHNMQIELMNSFSMPLIPITALEELPKTLQGFRFGMDLGGKTCKVRPASAVQTLAPHCAVGRALPEHVVNVLSDVTDGLKDLAVKVSTEEGRRFLAEYLDEGEFQKVVEFWEGEYQVQ